MKLDINKVIIAISLVFYLIAFFLPSYYGELGYNCAKFCLLEIWKFSEGPWFPWYYIPFNITNLIMMIIPALIIIGFYHKMIKKKVHILLKYLATFLGLHVISWLVIHLVSGEFQNIQIGYYFWTISICVFVISLWSDNDMFMKPFRATNG